MAAKKEYRETFPGSTMTLQRSLIKLSYYLREAEKITR